MFFKAYGRKVEKKMPLSVKIRNFAADMNIQYIIVAAVIIVAVGYAAWRTWRLLSHADDPCCNCGCCDGKRPPKSGECPKYSGEDKK